jgi:GNAT superfamily N-acetyltransferase
MTIRAARLPDDEPAIHSFIWGLQKFENVFEANRRLDPAFAAEHWPVMKARAAERGAIFIAEAAGKPVGWALVLDEPGDVFVERIERRHGFIAELFVEEAARGQGHGRALIGACEDWTRGRGVKVLIINVLARNDKAAAVYGRGGFAPYNLNLRKYL